MKDVKSFGGRLGFTLIELLVVIGIIGIVIAATMPMIRGSSDSGLAAKCMSNMHNLAEAALVFANSNGDEHGYYPVAGFYRTAYVAYSGNKYKPKYMPRRAWISNYGDAKQLNGSTETVQNGDVPHFTDSNQEKSTFAITNGAVWDCVGRSFDAYRCPVHSQTYEKANNGRPPAWSFVMNQAFGFDKDGKGLGGAPAGSIKSATINVQSFGVRVADNDAKRNPDKVLMFAEVQGLNFTEKKSGITMKALVSGNGPETDGVLQYDKEVMGFNHPMGKGRHCGHVAFADGHVEKIMMPTDQGNIKKLTEWLCTGKDIVFSGATYSEAN